MGIKWNKTRSVRSGGSGIVYCAEDDWIKWYTEESPFEASFIREIWAKRWAEEIRNNSEFFKGTKWEDN